LNPQQKLHKKTINLNSNILVNQHPATVEDSYGSSPGTSVISHHVIDVSAQSCTGDHHSNSTSTCPSPRHQPMLEYESIHLPGILKQETRKRRDKKVRNKEEK